MNKKEIHTVLSAENLSIGYSAKKTRTVISEGIDFSLAEGSLTALVGANGIGKSTLLRTLANVQKPLNGSILLKQKSIASYTSNDLANELSLVLTEQAISKNLSVYELVSLGRYPYTNWIGSLTEEDKKVVETALADTEVSALKHKKCFELSDGQLQRVFIARALAQDTPIIILDEPTSHLDIYHRAYVLQLLKKLSIEKNKTILFSTHNIDMAIQISDTMIVMLEDAVIFETPSELIKQGCFEKLFPQHLIQFDAQSERFVLKNNS